MKNFFAIFAFPLAFTACAATSGVKPYPRDTCIVTDNKIGSMGTPVTKVYGGREVKFCCSPCVAAFEKNPRKYLAKIR
ncbi:MAG: hypothetical protein V4733_01645 [Verrucomicrobiota bacterium]